MSDPTLTTSGAKPQVTAARRSFASRLYMGEVGINIVDRRQRWLMVAAIILLVAIVGMGVRGFSFGMEFVGGNSFQVPASVGTLTEVQDAATDAGAEVVSGQEVSGTGSSSYLIRTQELSSEEALAVKNQLATEFGLSPDQISDSLVSGAWGDQITRSALIALIVFIALVIGYLVIRFEARMAVAAVAGLLLDMVFAAGVYAIVGFEVTPATVIGFLTIMGFGLYDSVVVFDKIHENTKGITASSTETYGEAANLAVNQTLIRSVNTSVVALLPVGGLLFIGAGLLGAGTLKDLGLVLFVGMAVAFYTSLFIASPLLVELKAREPRFRAHTQRVLAKRAALANREARRNATSDGSAPDPDELAPVVVDPQLAELAGAAPKVGARPSQAARRSATRRRPSSGKRR